MKWQGKKEKKQEQKPPPGGSGIFPKCDWAKARTVALAYLRIARAVFFIDFSIYVDRNEWRTIFRV